MTTTLDRLADAATNARGGADLYRFSLSDRIPDDAFVRNGDGSITITGVDLLKAGTFNGLSLLDSDLESMVGHFVALRDAGIFVPPFRIDHSWSVLSVVGYFENLETYRRVDTTDSMEKNFLRGDVRLTGSVDYKPPVLVDAIKRGALRNRSSELGYYVTNAGVEIPLAFYGCAFVDIPAVEGLSDVTLRRPEPHSITNLSSPEGTPRMDPDETTSNDNPGQVDETTETGPGVPDPGAAGNPAAGDGTQEPDPVGDAEEADAANDQATADAAATSNVDQANPPSTGGDTAPAAGSEQDQAGETNDASGEVESLRREVARLRQESADREIATLAAAGVIVEANREDAEFLLRHDDPEVRRRAGITLGHFRGTVDLGRRRGATALSADGTSRPAGGKLIELGMTADEVGPLWASLTSQERRDNQADYDRWSRDHYGN